MSQRIQNTCPNCGNTEFEIIKTLSKFASYGHKAGHYRVKCVMCDFVETVKSKNPLQDAVQNPPENMDLDEQKRYQDWLNEQRTFNE